jgi:hypothetical protein
MQSSMDEDEDEEGGNGGAVFISLRRPQLICNAYLLCVLDELIMRGIPVRLTALCSDH